MLEPRILLALAACFVVVVLLCLSLRRKAPAPLAEEARPLLRGELESWRLRTYEELESRIDEPLAKQVEGPRGIPYQIQVQVFWDDHPGGVLRVRGAIDDGGVRAFMPFIEDFLVRADGTFVDEAG